MTLIWIRGRQPAGGKSRWHLLSDERAGQHDLFDLSPGPNARWLPRTESWQFALTRCGYALTDIERLPGTETISPGHFRNRVVKLPKSPGPICRQCLDLGEFITNSVAI